MGAFVLRVEITVAEGGVERFLELIGENARASVKEPGCRQFDVARSLNDPAKIMLYEVYDDAAAFEAHRNTPHFKAFFEAAGSLIADRTGAQFERVHP